VRTAAMLAAKTPYDAVSQGMKDMIAIQTSNANLYKQLQTGGYTPAQRVQAWTQQRLALTGEISKAQNEIRDIMKSNDYQFAPDQATRDELIKAPTARIQAARRGLDEVTSQLRQIASGGQSPLVAPAVRGLLPQGGSQVTAPRLSVADQVARAIGGAGGAPWGESAGGGGAYPARRVSPIDTGVQPIGGGGSGPGPMGPDELEAYVQSILQGVQ
jgi:hypothetical protein